MKGRKVEVYWRPRTKSCRKWHRCVWVTDWYARVQDPHFGSLSFMHRVQTGSISETEKVVTGTAILLIYCSPYLLRAVYNLCQAWARIPTPENQSAQTGARGSVTICVCSAHTKVLPFVIPQLSTGTVLYSSVLFSLNETSAITNNTGREKILNVIKKAGYWEYTTPSLKPPTV